MKHGNLGEKVSKGFPKGFKFPKPQLVTKYAETEFVKGF